MMVDGRCRNIALAAVALIPIGSVLGCGSQAGRSRLADGGARQIIRAGPPAGGLPYSPGILVGNTLYLAGTIGEDSANNIVPGGIEAEARRALANVGEVLSAAGMGFQDVTSVTVYLASFDDFAKFNEVYRQVFPVDPPARAAVQVAGLIGGAKVELQMIAVKPGN